MNLYSKNYGILKRQQRLNKIVGFNLNRRLLALIVTLCVASIFIAFQTSTNKTVKNTEQTFLDIFAPFGAMLSKPRSMIVNFSNYSGDLYALLDEPDIINKLNERTKQLSLLNTQLQYENALLREELGLTKRSPLQTVTARVLTHPDFNGINRIIIEGGANRGIKKGAPVITSSGVVGKIDRVSTNYSRVQILTSVDSRVPVSIGANNLNAIVSGNNTRTLDISVKERDAKIAIGDKVLTSGRGGIFPYGLLVGHAVKAGVAPAVDLNKLDYVQVLKDSEKSDLSEG